MDRLQVWSAEFSVAKQKAVEDAKKMQISVNEECAKAGKEVPPYHLLELIGKGGYGRVYKATGLKSKKVVSVKIIDVEEGDSVNPRMADTFSEFLKEVNALKLLSESGARNINHVFDVLPVGQAMWLVTEYCAGGSVSTLMKPTAPGGLQEKWIIPILREVAEAIYWVHKQGIIHRDIKCANVLITEAGHVQLCDFGVAGVIENKIDKRSTFIGTPHWMAPELFDIYFDPNATTTYGTEVDVWAFGSMVYEIASGLPPNVANGFDITKLGQYLKTHAPRLEGDQYSPRLKDLVGFCLETEPSKRPTIEQVQQHPCIANSSAEYPTATLANLVKAYKLWEAQGNVRKSLFNPGGAPAPWDYSPTALANDEWNFSTTMDLDAIEMDSTDVQAVFDVYGTLVDFVLGEPTSKPNPRSRRRPPPHLTELTSVKAPLEKVFDPNTISNYEDNARAYYGKALPTPRSLDVPPGSMSDLPLRNDSLASADLRESLIDLDASLHGDELSRFVDMETIKAGPRISMTDTDATNQADLIKPPYSDPADTKNNRRTQDWKFPVMAPASANSEMSRFSFNEERRPNGGLVPESGGRPPLLHHPTDPTDLQSQGLDLAVPRPQDSRASVSSLIDLDESIPTMAHELTRPSTANSDAVSVGGSDTGGVNPFDLERHASLHQPISHAQREPSIYISDNSEFTSQLAQPADEMRGMPEYPPHFCNGSAGTGYSRNPSCDDNSNCFPTEFFDADCYVPMAERQPCRVVRQIPHHGQQLRQQPLHQPCRGQWLPLRSSSRGRYPSMRAMVLAAGLPSQPPPLDVDVMQGLADPMEVRVEVLKMIDSLQEHLQCMVEKVGALPVRGSGGGGQEREEYS